MTETQVFHFTEMSQKFIQRLIGITQTLNSTLEAKNIFLKIPRSLCGRPMGVGRWSKIENCFYGNFSRYIGKGLMRNWMHLWWTMRNWSLFVWSDFFSDASKPSTFIRLESTCNYLLIMTPHTIFYTFRVPRETSKWEVHLFGFWPPPIWPPHMRRQIW